MTKNDNKFFSIITLDEIKTTFNLEIFTNVPNEIILFICILINDREI